MARFDPRTYPDRLAFEAHARRLRQAELGRLLSAARAWFTHPREELADGVGRLVGGAGFHSHR